MNEQSIRFVDTPVGRCRVRAGERGVTEVYLVRGSEASCQGVRGPAAATRHAEHAIAALAEYFAGARRHFDDVALDLHGTPFQRAVWQGLRAIPFGQTRSYGQLAESIGSPGAQRAVGMANHRNPAWVVVPCHRVVQADGSLGGYAGGTQVKRWLLEFEGSSSASLFGNDPCAHRASIGGARG